MDYEEIHQKALISQENLIVWLVFPISYKDHFVFERLDNMVMLKLFSPRQWRFAVNCVICNMKMDDIDQAIDQGWTPYFYEGTEEYGPVCPGCSEILLFKAKDGEMELKEEYLGKMQYNEIPFHEPSEQEMLILMAFENTIQSILN